MQAQRRSYLACRHDPGTHSQGQAQSIYSAQVLFTGWPKSLPKMRPSGGQMLKSSSCSPHSRPTGTASVPSPARSRASIGASGATGSGASQGRFNNPSGIQHHLSSASAYNPSGIPAQSYRQMKTSDLFKGDAKAQRHIEVEDAISLQGRRKSTKCTPVAGLLSTERCRACSTQSVQSS